MTGLMIYAEKNGKVETQYEEYNIDASFLMKKFLALVVKGREGAILFSKGKELQKGLKTKKIKPILNIA